MARSRSSSPKWIQRCIVAAAAILLVAVTVPRDGDREGRGNRSVDVHLVDLVDVAAVVIDDDRSATAIDRAATAIDRSSRLGDDPGAAARDGAARA